MVSISSGVARSAESLITETRYCIWDHLLWFVAPLVGGLSPLLRTALPRSDTPSRVSSRHSRTPVANDPAARRFRGGCWYHQPAWALRQIEVNSVGPGDVSQRRPAVEEAHDAASDTPSQY